MSGAGTTESRKFCACAGEVELATLHLRKNGRNLFNVLFDNLTDVRFDQLAGRANDHRERQSNKVDPGGFRDSHRVFLANEDRVVELRFFGVGDDVVVEVDGNADDLQVQIRIVILGLS